MMDEGDGVREEGWKIKFEGGGERWWKWAMFWSGSGSGSMENIMDSDPWKILWIWIQHNDMDPLDPDLQHCIKYSSTKIWNVFQFTCNYLLLKAPQGRVWNTLPQGYGMYFSWLYLSLIESSTWENVKYSSTRVWTVFQCAIIVSYWKPWGECKL